MTNNTHRAAHAIAEFFDAEGGMTAVDEAYEGDCTGIAEVLADAGLLMPDLPEPYEPRKWFGGPLDVIRSRWGNVVVFCNAARDTGRIVLSAKDARDLARALLAAAAEAEAEGAE